MSGAAGEPAHRGGAAEPARLPRENRVHLRWAYVILLALQVGLSSGSMSGIVGPATIVSGIAG